MRYNYVVVLLLDYSNSLVMRTNQMQSISELESLIRDYINSPRKQYKLRQNKADWNKLCSSLDVIGDTELAFNSYLESIDKPATYGEKYLILYGILQVLFVQQDAVKHLAESLNIEHAPEPILSQVREIRNDSIGHPTKRGSRKGRAFNFISRVSMSRANFKLMTTYADRNYKLMDISVPKLINDQRNILRQILIDIIEKLKKEEMEHRTKFRDKKLVDIFPETLHYYYEKITEAIYDNTYDSFGMGIVNLVIEVIEEFKKALDKRGVLYAYDPVIEEIKTVEYPLAELREYFESRENSKLNREDAYIFLFFIRKRIDMIKEMASEIDEDYASDP